MKEIGILVPNYISLRIVSSEINKKIPFEKVYSDSYNSKFISDDIIFRVMIYNLLRARGYKFDKIIFVNNPLYNYNIDKLFSLIKDINIDCAISVMASLNDMNIGWLIDKIYRMLIECEDESYELELL